MGDRKITRLDPDERYEQILIAAIKLAEKTGSLLDLTRDGVAEFAKVSQGQIGHYFESMEGLREAIIERAIEDKNAKVLYYGLTMKHPVALAAPDKLKKAAAVYLLG